MAAAATESADRLRARPYNPDDDLIAATHGRSFWILDNIGALREAVEAGKTQTGYLFHAATAIRIDNDSFIGTPLPPEEPTGKNPPDGAIIDYYLGSSAHEVQLEIHDPSHKLIRRFSSASLPPHTRWHVGDSGAGGLPYDSLRQWNGEEDEKPSAS